MENFFRNFTSWVIFIVNTIKDLVYNVTGGKSGEPFPSDEEDDDE